MTFAWPSGLILLCIVPLWWWWSRPTRDSSLLAANAGAAGAVSLRDWQSVAIEAGPRFLRAMALALMVLAICRPQMVHSHREAVNDGVGIVLAIDLSTSMLAQEMAEGKTRLDVAKESTRRFLARRGDDAGLVVFAGEALTRLPLTSDRSAAQAAVDSLEIGLLRDGTDIAGATAAAGGLFRDAPHRKRVLILVTDGAHNKPGIEPAIAARAAAAFDVKIYAIAIGAVPENDEASGDSLETVLSQAARISGGRYFQAADTAALDAIYSEIDALTVTPAPRLVVRTSHESITHWLLLGALALLVLGAAISGSRWGVVP